MARFLIPVIRAAVQAAVALIVAYVAVKFGLDVPPNLQDALIGAVTVALTGLVARSQQILEHRFPRLGKLLHSPWYNADIEHELDKARDRIAKKIVESANKTLTSEAIAAADTATLPAVPPAPDPNLP